MKSFMEVKDVLRKLEQTTARWLRVYWCDYTSTIRCRLIPMNLVKNKLRSNTTVTHNIPKATLSLLPNGHIIPGLSCIGGYTLVPDFSSLRLGPSPNQVTCAGEFYSKKDRSGVTLCPRTVLRRSLNTAAQHGLEFNLGFEIEFTVTEQDVNLRNVDNDWSTAHNLADWGRQDSFISDLDELIDQLETADIPIEQLHIESGPGRYELVLRALPVLQACDAYLFTRQVIELIAVRHGLRVTLHPKPFLHALEEVANEHVAIQLVRGDEPHLYESFYAGILRHLRAIMAFTYANPHSYGRVTESSHAGVRWAAWGSESPKMPLRKCYKGHWEYGLLDGLANPYLALAAVISAGTSGVLEKVALTWKTGGDGPPWLFNAKRDETRTPTRLPETLLEALEALTRNETLVALLHPSVVERHVAVKKAEARLPAEKEGQSK